MSRLLQALSPSMARAWDRASARERGFVLVAVIVVVLASGWAWVWQPMNTDIERMERDRARQQRVLVTAQAQANDLVSLRRADAPTRPSDARAAVERVLAERALRAPLPPADPKGGQVRLLLDAVRLTELVAMLDTWWRADGLRLIEATFTVRVEPGTVRADLLLGR